MITAFDIYLLGVLFNSQCYLSGVGIFLGIILLAAIMLFPILADFDEWSTIKTWLKRIVYALIAIIVLMGIAPSKQTVIAMVTVPPVINNEKVQQLPNNVLDFVNEWLKEYTPKHEKNKEDTSINF